MWITLFYIQGDAALWHEWFWVNHVGRLTGEAADKGHIRTGQPFYYVIQLLGYGVPWTPLIFFWYGAMTLKAIKEKYMSREDLFLYYWGIVSIVVLTISATKRGIYLTPVLPVFAVTAAMTIAKGIPKWFKPYAIFWMAFSLAMITVITGFPLVAGFLANHIPPRILAGLAHVGYYNILSLAGLGACLALIFKYRDRFPQEFILVLVTSVLYICLLGAPMMAIDKEKSMGSDIKEFVSQIPESRRARLAGTELSETLVSCFYYYCDLNVPLVWDKQIINDIVSGKDSRFDSLITKKKSRVIDESNLADVPYKVMAEIITGTDAALFWIEAP